MKLRFNHLITAMSLITVSPAAFAGTDIFFNPLTQSAVVADPNALVEMNSPWLVPPGLSQDNLTSMDEIEGDVAQSTVRVPGLGANATMWDMLAFDDAGENIFIPHETSIGAGASRYNIGNDSSQVLFRGDLGGATGNWSKDYAAFDPATFTPNGTLFCAEEWAGEGRVIEVLNPHAPPAAIKIRELDSIANVAHEGLRFSLDQRTIYFVDEWNSGSIYKFVMARKGDYTRGQTFVLKVDAYNGNAADDYTEPSNATAPRVGAATWIPLTDASGKPLTNANPFKNGPTNDPRTNTDTRGGRPAADEVRATPYGRPEDIEIGRLANGSEVLYFAATSENSIYAVELLSKTKAFVQLAAGPATPKNKGFAPTSGAINSPDNLAQDALGNIYVIEDAPNGSATGGDIWFMRDVNTDGVAESMDHFMSIQVAGSEATGMIFNPAKPTQFVVAIQHPASTDLEAVPSGFGDAIWAFDLKHIVSPPCVRDGNRRSGLRTCHRSGADFAETLERAAR